MLKSFFKDSIIYTIPTILSRGISIILVPLYTRVLNPSDYGSLDLFMVFTSIVNLVIALEISQGVSRFYASEGDSYRKTLYASTSLWFTLVCYTLFCSLMIYLSSSVYDFIMGQSNHLNAFRCGIFYVLVNGVFYLAQNQLRWELKSKEYFFVSITLTIVTAVLGLYFTCLKELGLFGLILAMTIGCITALIFAVFLLRQSYRFRFCRNCLLEMLKYSSPFVASGIAVWITLYVDRLMINHFLSIYDVGLFSVGYKVSSIAGLAIVGFQGALTPLVFAHYKNPKTANDIEKIFRYFIAISLSIYLFLGLFVQEILILMTAPSYYDASLVVAYLIPAIFFSKMYIFAPGIGIAKKTEIILLIYLFGGFLNLLLNYLLIPKFGIMGASLATMFSYFFIFLLHIFYSQKYYYVGHKWSMLILASVIAFMIVKYLPKYYNYDSYKFFIKIVFIVCFFVFLFLTKIIKVNEFKSFIENLKLRIKN